MVCSTVLHILLPLLQGKSNKVKNIIEEGKIEAVVGRIHHINPQISKGNLKEMKLSTVSTTIIESDKEVSKLNHHDFMGWLMRKQFSIEDCQAFKGTL